MPRRVRCEVCGRTHNWNEYKTSNGLNICIRCRKNKRYNLEYEETIEIEEIREKKEKKRDDEKRVVKKKEEKVKVDRNEWLHELLDRLIDRRVTFFTRDGTHTEGSIKEIGEEFLILDMTRQSYTSPAGVEVISNIDNVGLESFNKYFLRIDDIVGFGEVIQS